MLPDGCYRRSWVSRAVIYPILFGGIPLVFGLGLMIVGDPSVPGGLWQERDAERARIAVVLVAIGAAAVSPGVITLLLKRRPYLAVDSTGIHLPGHRFQWSEIRRVRCETSTSTQDYQEHSRLYITAVRHGQEVAYDFDLDGLSDPPTIGHDLFLRWAHEIGKTPYALPSYEARIWVLLREVLWELLFVYPRTGNARFVPAFLEWQRSASALYFANYAGSGQEFLEAWNPVAFNRLMDLQQCWDRKSIDVAVFAAFGCSLIAAKQSRDTSDPWLSRHFQRIASILCGLTPDVRSELSRHGFALPLVIQSSLADFAADPELLPLDRRRSLEIGVAATVASLLVSGDPWLLSSARCREVSSDSSPSGLSLSTWDQTSRFLAQLTAAGLISRRHGDRREECEEQAMSASLNSDDSSFVHLIEAVVRNGSTNHLTAIESLLAQDELLGTSVLLYVATTAGAPEARKTAFNRLIQINPLLAAQVAALEWWRDENGTLSPREVFDLRRWIGPLHYAIWMTSSWHWWTGDDAAFLFGFAPVCMWEKELLPGEIPSEPLCIGFREVSHVLFFQLPVDDEEPLADNWPDRLRDDGEPGFRVDEIAFCDADRIAETLRKATHVRCAWGEELSLAADAKTARYSMVLQAERAGVVVVADYMDIMKGSAKKILSTDDAHSLVLAWQTYRLEYRRRRSTQFPLPQDHLCEIVHDAPEQLIERLGAASE